MAEVDRKALIREYKENPPSAGVYRVRNTASGKSLIGSTRNLPGMLNRQRFELEMGSHPEADLQRDWNDLGQDAFEFEVLDRLEPDAAPAADVSEDLRVLKEMWLERIVASGGSLYRQLWREG